MDRLVRIMWCSPCCSLARGRNELRAASAPSSNIRRTSLSPSPEKRFVVAAAAAVDEDVFRSGLQVRRWLLRLGFDDGREGCVGSLLPLLLPLPALPSPLPPLLPLLLRPPPFPSLLPPRPPPPLPSPLPSPLPPPLPPPPLLMFVPVEEPPPPRCPLSLGTTSGKKCESSALCVVEGSRAFAAAAAAATIAGAATIVSAVRAAVVLVRDFVKLLTRFNCTVIGKNLPALRLNFGRINASCSFSSVSSSIVAAAARVFVSVGISSLEGREGRRSSSRVVGDSGESAR
jgi:hypothetical protein